MTYWWRLKAAQSDAGVNMSTELRDGRDRGWFHIDNVLLDDHGATIGAIGVAVYATLARHADRAGVCFPSYARVAALLDLSRPTVIAAMRKLKEAGLITIETVKAPGRRPRNVYTLVDLVNRSRPRTGQADIPVPHPDPLTGKAGVPVHVAHQSIGQAHAPVNDVALTGQSPLPVLVKDVAPNKTQQPDPENQTHSPLFVPPGEDGPSSPHAARFARFWAAYPRKDKKGYAERWWRTHRPDDAWLATMLVTIAAAKGTAQWQRAAGQYIPLPITWLESKGWESEYVPAPLAVERSITDDHANTHDTPLAHGKYAAALHPHPPALRCDAAALEGAGGRTHRDGGTGAGGATRDVHG